MSQYGAHQMAKEGLSYTKILEFYYPGTKLEKLNIEPDKGGAPKPSNPSPNQSLSLNLNLTKTVQTEPKPDPGQGTTIWYS